MGCASGKQRVKQTHIKVDELTEGQIAYLSRESDISVKQLKLYVDFLYKNKIHLISCIKEYSSYGVVFTVFDQQSQQFVVLKIYENSSQSIQAKEIVQPTPQKNILKVYNTLYNSKLSATFLLIELSSGTLETLIQQKKREQTTFSKIEVYNMALQLINGLANASDLQFDLPEVTPKTVLVDRCAYSLKLVQAHIHNKVFALPFSTNNLSTIASINSHTDFRTNLKNIQKEVQNVGLVILNLTNPEQAFTALKVNVKLQREKVLSRNFQSLNNQVILPMLDCNFNVQIDFLIDMKAALKQLISEERKNAGKLNLCEAMRIKKPFMSNKTSNNGENSKKKFQSLEAFTSFSDKEYLSQIEIKFEEQMNEQDFISLEEGMRDSENLESIELIYKSSNRFNSEQVMKLCTALKKGLSLESLKIQFLSSQISSAGIESLFEHLSEISNLQSLTLKFNESLINESQAVTIQQHLQAYSQLTHLELDFSNCSLKDRSLSIVTQGVFQNTHIQKFNLILFQIHAPDVQIYRDFGQSLATPSSIQYFDLDLRYNHLDSDSLKVIINGLTQMQNLKKLQLNLSNNVFFSDGILYVSENLSKIQNLEKLSLRLHSTGLKSSICRQFTEKFQLYPKLKILNLRLQNNLIDDEGAEELVKQIRKQQTVKHLLIDLSNNKINQKEKEKEHIQRIMKMKRIVGYKFIYCF